MRILLINKYHYQKGGAEKAYFDMAEILTEAGHEVAYFAMEDPGNKKTPWSRFFVKEVSYHQENQSLWQKIDLGLRILWNKEANTKLQALIDEFHPDVAHAHNIYHQLSPSIFHVLQQNGIPIALTLHDYKIVSPSYTLFAHHKVWEHTSGVKAILDRVVDNSYAKSSVCALEKWFHKAKGSYDLVDVLISPSQFLADTCQKLGLKKEIEVLANPLLHIPKEGGEKVPGKIVFVGRLSEEKGVDVLIRAFRDQSAEKKLHIIGSGPEEAKLKMLVKELNLTDTIIFHGALFGEELDREVLSSEALVVPSIWYENLPYVVTENLARGIVVIASDSGGMKSRITHGENGLLFPMGESATLSKLLQDLDQYNLEAIRKNAIESTKDLDPSFFLQRIEALYQMLLKEKTAS